MPHILAKKEIRNQSPESDATARVVAAAIDEVFVKEGLNEDAPVIILGSMGFIGTRVVGYIKESCCGPIVEVDVKQGLHFADQIAKITKYFGKNALLVNVTRDKIIDQYIPYSLARADRVE